jgi:hypothetical protein
MGRAYLCQSCTTQISSRRAETGLSLRAQTHCGSSRKRPFGSEQGSSLLRPRSSGETISGAVFRFRCEAGVIVAHRRHSSRALRAKSNFEMGVDWVLSPGIANIHLTPRNITSVGITSGKGLPPLPEKDMTFNCKPSNGAGLSSNVANSFSGWLPQSGHLRRQVPRRRS